MKEKTKRKKRFQVYRYFSANGSLLYVGSSLSAVSRAAQHRANSHWYDQAVRMDIENHNSRKEMLFAEKLAIYKERPEFNVVNARSEPRIDIESVPDEIMADIWKMVYRKGWTPEKAAKKHGVASETVNYWIKTHDFVAGPKLQELWATPAWPADYLQSNRAADK